jgi:hypothetical protein
MKGDELTNKSMKSVTDEFKYLLKNNPQNIFEYF